VAKIVAGARPCIIVDPRPFGAAASWSDINALAEKKRDMLHSSCARRRRTAANRPLVPGAAALIVLGLIGRGATTTTAHAALAPYVTISPITDGNPSTNELGFAGVEINATAFKNQSLATVGDYQFTTFYAGSSQANHELIVGRRNLAVSPNTWTLLRTGFTSFNINDSHNVSTIGLDGDGFLHLSWGMHNNAMQYARSTTSVVNDNPLAMTGVLSNALPLQSGGDFTYPEFWNIPGSGDLLLAYRTGQSGNGEYQLARWDNATNAWSAVHAARNTNDSSAVQPWIDNDFSGDSNADANAYHNGLQYDSTGRLHVTWTWRTGSNPGPFDDFQSNHNLMYAYSDNHGVDWHLQNGALLQRDPTGAPAITHDIDEANATPVISLPMGSSLINQSSSAIGPDDHLYTASWYAPQAATGNHTRQYMLVEFDGTTWKQHQVGARTSENGNNRVPESQLGAFRMSRPIVMTDDDNRVFVVFSDTQRSQGVTVAYSENAARDDWQYIDLATNDNMRLWEPKFDMNRWEQDGVLSMLYQPGGNGIGPNTVSVLEWDARAYFADLVPTADFDDDGDVDGTDLLAWQRGLGTTIDATRADGDADHDGDVDDADLGVWRAGFGAAASTSAARVPEPACGALALASLAAVTLFSRRRKLSQ
jgi:hypothetical protein